MRYYEEVLELNLAKEIAKKELEFKDALTDLVDRLRSRGKLADVDLSVESVLKKEKDSLGRDELNLHLTFLSQGIKDEAENETADFPPGKYSLLDSEAATALVDFFVKSSAEKLAESGIDATVVDMHTIKPLDTDLIDVIVDRCGAIVTAEDHSVIGGLGGAVAEYLSSTSCAPLERIGVKDRFGESASSEEMLEMMGLKSKHICQAVENAIARKS